MYRASNIAYQVFIYIVLRSFIISVSAGRTINFLDENSASGTYILNTIMLMFTLDILYIYHSLAFGIRTAKVAVQ